MGLGFWFSVFIGSNPVKFLKPRVLYSLDFFFKFDFYLFPLTSLVKTKKNHKNNLCFLVILKQIFIWNLRFETKYTRKTRNLLRQFSSNPSPHFSIDNFPKNHSNNFHWNFKFKLKKDSTWKCNWIKQTIILFYLILSLINRVCFLVFSIEPFKFHSIATRSKANQQRTIKEFLFLDVNLKKCVNFPPIYFYTLFQIVEWRRAKKDKNDSIIIWRCSFAEK